MSRSHAGPLLVVVREAVSSIASMRSRHVSVVIRRCPREVYQFAAEPDNLPRWAAGLASSKVTREGDALVADGPMGQVRITFAERNAYGSSTTT